MLPEPQRPARVNTGRVGAGWCNCLGLLRRLAAPAAGTVSACWGVISKARVCGHAPSAPGRPMPGHPRRPGVARKSNWPPAQPAPTARQPTLPMQGPIPADSRSASPRPWPACRRASSTPPPPAKSSTSRSGPPTCAKRQTASLLNCMDWRLRWPPRRRGVRLPDFPRSGPVRLHRPPMESRRTVAPPIPPLRGPTSFKLGPGCRRQRGRQARTEVQAAASTTICTRRWPFHSSRSSR